MGVSWPAWEVVREQIVREQSEAHVAWLREHMLASLERARVRHAWTWAPGIALWINRWTTWTTTPDRLVAAHDESLRAMFGAMAKLPGSLQA